MEKESKIYALSNSLFMALILSSFLTFLVIAYSSIIFSGHYSIYAPIGYFSMFIGAIIVNLVYSRYANLPFLTAGPDSVISIFFGLAILPILNSVQAPSSVVMTIIAFFCFTSFLTSIMLYLVGKFKLGQTIRFVPYTVIGGFLTGLSFMLIKSSYAILTNESLFDAFKNIHSVELIVCTLVTTVILFGASFVIKSSNATSILLLLILILFNIVTITVFKHADLSYFFLRLPDIGTQLSIPSLDWHALALIDFVAIYRNIFPIVGLAFLAIFIHLLNNSSIEIFSGCNDDLDKQLTLTGKANCFTSLLAGYITIPNVTVSLLSFSMKGNHRIVMLMASIISIITLYYLHYIIPFLPKFIISSVILLVAINLFKRWAIETWKILNFFEYASIIFIAVFIVLFGLLYGIIAGLIINSLFFIISFSHSKTTRYHVTDSDYQSNLIRPLDQIEYLDTEGKKIHLYKLQSYLFFGSAKKLADRIIELLNEALEIDYFIVDFSLVTGIDISGCYCFVRLEQEAIKRDVTIIYTNIDSRLKKKLALMGSAIQQYHHYFATIDEGLEWCENELLKNRHQHYFDFEYKEALPHLIRSKMAFNVFKQYMTLTRIKKGEYLFREADKSDALYFVKSGLISIVKHSGNQLVRLNKGGAGTLVGEIAFFIESERTADVVAEKDTELYELSRDNFQKLQKEYPDIALEFMENIIKILATNLKKTNQKVMMLL